MRKFQGCGEYTLPCLDRDQIYAYSFPVETSSSPGVIIQKENTNQLKIYQPLKTNPKCVAHEGRGKLQPTLVPFQETDQAKTGKQQN